MARATSLHIYIAAAVAALKSRVVNSSNVWYPFLKVTKCAAEESSSFPPLPPADGSCTRSRKLRWSFFKWSGLFSSGRLSLRMFFCFERVFLRLYFFGGRTAL